MSSGAPQLAATDVEVPGVYTSLDAQKVVSEIVKLVAVA